jgi:hypothetical protein
METKKKEVVINERSLFEFARLLVFWVYVKAVYQLTRFWPFSLFWQNKTFHYDHRYLYEVVDNVEEYLEKNHFDFSVKECSENEYFFQIKGKFTKHKRAFGTEELEARVRKAFAKEHDSVFVRTDEPGVHTIMLSKRCAK